MPNWIFKYLIIVFFSPSLFSQSVIQGKIISSETKSPLAAVSVYLNNTSIGTTTNDKGFFILRNIPSDKFKLVASSVGYETYTQIIDPKKSSQEILISLKPKLEQLGSVVLLPDDPNAWRKYGKAFTDLFIGMNTNSNQCHIQDTDNIKLRLNPDNTLTAFAKEPIVIVNYGLGYEIKYKLEEFEYDFNTKVLTYNGYALFKDLGKSGKKKPNKYSREREETYQGSLLHFMRTFFRNKLGAQGFEMRNLGTISNPEKDRAKEKFRQEWLAKKDSVIQDTLIYDVTIIPPGCPNCMAQTQTITKFADSTDYFRKKLHEPDSVISHQLVLSDSIGFGQDSVTAGMYFKDSLEVSYKLKQIPNKYRAFARENRKETYPVSQFVFIHKRPIYINANGYYYGPHDLKITGFWAWEETIATMLPYDYVRDE